MMLRCFAASGSTLNDQKQIMNWLSGFPQLGVFSSLPCLILIFEPPLGFGGHGPSTSDPCCLMELAEGQNNEFYDPWSHNQPAGL